MKTDNHNIKITHGDKVLFPKSGLTKNDLIRYYEKIGGYMLPYLSDRPLTMQRFPKGIGDGGFFQKNASQYFPDWIQTEEIRKVGGWVNHVICNTKETLIYLVNQYATTFHIALSTIDNIEYPDRLIFDLDPPKGDFALAIKGAKALRNLLENELGFKIFLMTTGSKGLHIMIPLKQEENFNEVHVFAKNVSDYICSKHPEEFTTAIRKVKREGRLFIDFLRNSYAQTSVAPFSVRAIENAPVAVPIHWAELDNEELTAQSWNIQNIFDRLSQVEDPWKDFNIFAMNIQDAKKRLELLVKDTLKT